MAPEAAPELSRSEPSAQEARRAANRRKVRKHRQRLRAQGMRPIQIWVPDVLEPEFAAEALRQSLLVAHSPEEFDIQAFIDSMYEWPAEWGAQLRSARSDATAVLLIMDSDAHERLEGVENVGQFNSGHFRVEGRLCPQPIAGTEPKHTTKAQVRVGRDGPLARNDFADA